MTEHKQSKLKTALEIIIGIIISAIIVYFTFSSLGNFKPEQLLTDKINWWLALVSACVFGLSTLVRSFVYTYGIDRQMNWFVAWRLTAVGNAANMVTPLRMGEGLRLALFPRGYKASKRVKLTVIPAIADFAVILLLSILAVFFAGFNNKDVLKILCIASLSFFAIVIVAILILLAIPKTKRLVKGYLNRHTLHMTLWVLASWMLILISIYIGFLALGYDSFKSIAYTLASFATMNLVTFIPLSPGNIGLFESSVVLGLASMGISSAPALVAGLLLHSIQYAIMLPLGLLLYVGGFKKHITKLRRRPRIEVQRM